VELRPKIILLLLLLLLLGHDFKRGIVWRGTNRIKKGKRQEAGEMGMTEVYYVYA
jgi:hypothetical protein